MKYLILIVCEVASALCLLLGMWLIYPPAALILGGLGGVLGTEMNLSRMDREHERKKAKASSP